MGDDLVNRLREAFVDLDDLNDAADRIEELESKLSKAVEALTRLDVGEGWAAQIARLTLAELTGGKDE